MKTTITIILMFMTFSFQGKNNFNKIQVSEKEYNEFPENYVSFLKIYEYYTNPIFDKKENELNETQRAFVYYYLVDGMINNSGVYSILIESLGEYNSGYLNALKLSNNKTDLNNFEELVRIFEKYKTSFMNQEIPEQLDTESDKFNKTVSEKIDFIESQWYDNTVIRDKQFKAFFVSIKQDILEIK